MLRSLRGFLILAALVLSLAHAADLSPAPTITVETGEIEGAKFKLARPARAWNRCLLLLAHGYVAADRPLEAGLNPDQLAQRALLDEGWIIAATSFRRNGVIVSDAIADLDALRAYLVEKFGTPERVIVEGDSMGGFIATLIAERDLADPIVYHGAIAVGAALDLKDPNSSVGLSVQPRIPLLFLCNQSESEAARAYAQAALPPDEHVVRPVLFRVARDGHVNVNQRERLAARRGLLLWLDHGRAALPPVQPESPFLDVTSVPPPQPSQVTLHADRRGFDARVTDIKATYGNIVLNAQPDDFAAIGIEKMARFQLAAHDRTFRVLLGRDFTNVKRGQWVAFPDAEGFILIARSYADAAGVAQLAVGDTVTIRRYGAAEEKPDDDQPAP